MSTARILVVDDDDTARAALEQLVSSFGFTVASACDGVDGLEQAASFVPDLVITDLTMPRMGGRELMTKLRASNRDCPVIVVTAVSDVNTAVEAMRCGASEFLTKPIDADLLSLTIHRALEQRKLKAESEEIRRQLRERSGEGLRGLLGTSAVMQRICGVARQVADSKATVLITGESGTGKGQLARTIHEISSRSNQPFVSVHCASIPETLLEAELFGHEKGAFTGADKRRIGRFEQANGGTLFLDEIGDISPLMQVKLLKVLQEKTIERIGSGETIPIDVRILAATNHDLGAEVRQGRFREDLFYRLNVVAIDMPPLRLRGNDVLALAEHFRERFARDGHKSVRGFTDAARAKLASHRWPGNVRELENSIERAIVLVEGELIDAEDLPFAPASTRSPLRIPGSTMAEIEQHAILSTLEAVNGSTSRAAEILGLSVRTIQYRLASYGLDDRKRRTSLTPVSGRVA